MQCRRRGLIAEEVMSISLAICTISALGITQVDFSAKVAQLANSFGRCISKQSCKLVLSISLHNLAGPREVIYNGNGERKGFNNTSKYRAKTVDIGNHAYKTLIN